MLEVIKYEADPPAAAMLSGWGERSQWFRNLQAAAPVAVSIGSDRWLNPAARLSNRIVWWRW